MVAWESHASSEFILYADRKWPITLKDRTDFCTMAVQSKLRTCNTVALSVLKQS